MCAASSILLLQYPFSEVLLLTDLEAHVKHRHVRPRLQLKRGITPSTSANDAHSISLIPPAAWPQIGIKWALPGAERQDSVFNGLQEVRAGAQLVAVHDSARPLVTAADASKCMADGYNIGAAVLGVQVRGRALRGNGFGNGLCCC